ncbi:MAG: protein kinase [Phycisphaerales bacterium]|nr:protein kinase [Phycisphaerales bacterium]
MISGANNSAIQTPPEVAGAAPLPPIRRPDQAPPPKGLGSRSADSDTVADAPDGAEPPGTPHTPETHDTPFDGPGPADSDAPPLAAGTSVGDCTIESVIGEGGSSVVYLARQRGLDRPVAIKVLRAPAGSRQARWRFTLEARVLGRLDHPGIARVFGSGVTGDGRPYLLMEYIDGSPITEAASGLTFREKVRLFLDVCDAVQAAHRSGVIHRDIKPSNVLVEKARADGRSTVKLLDFGIARVTQEGSALFTAHTYAGTLLGTAAYMSPEQAAGQHDEIGTTSDVFSLGVVLFELLAGRIPRPCFGGTGSASARLPLDEQLRRLRTDPAPPLSRFNRSLGGDLETIVARALEIAPARRYQSPGEFRADLERWLDKRPIEARRPGAWYRARLWVRRNRAATATIAAILTLGAFASVMGIKAWQLERREYESALAHYTLLLDQLVDEAARRTATREFRLGILEAASAGIQRDLHRRPDDLRLLALSAQSITGIASIRLEQARHDEALALQERALTLRQRIAAANPKDRAARLDLCTQMVRVGDIAGRIDPDRRLGMYQQAHGQLLELCQEDPTDACALDSLTWSYERLGRLIELQSGRTASMPYFRERHAAAERLLALEPDSVAATYSYAEGLQQLTSRLLEEARLPEAPDGPRFDPIRLAEAIDFQNRSIEAGRRLEALVPSEVRATHIMVRAVARMSYLNRQLDRLDEARPCAEEALLRAEKLFEQDPLNTTAAWCMLHALDELVQVHIAAGEPDQARRCTERQIAIIKQTPDRGEGESEFARALDQAREMRAETINLIARSRSPER